MYFTVPTLLNIYIPYRLRYGELAAKEAGAKKRALEKEDAKTRSEREDMALADEARQVVMYLPWTLLHDVCTVQTYQAETATATAVICNTTVAATACYSYDANKHSLT